MPTFTMIFTPPVISATLAKIVDTSSSSALVIEKEIANSKPMKSRSSPFLSGLEPIFNDFISSDFLF